MNNKMSYKKSVKLRKRKLQTGKVSLFLDIYLGNKKRQYEFLGIQYNPKNTPEKRQKLNIAEEIRLKREIELLSNDNGIISIYKKKSNYVDFFEKICNEKPKTEKAWRNTLKYLKEFTGGHIQFISINEIWLEEFKKFILTKVSVNTASTYFSKIKTSLNIAVTEKILNNNPSKNVKQVAKKDVKRTYLTLNELKLLNKTSCKNLQVKYAFLFACNTGLRLSDVKRLTWNDIQFDENKLIITQKKTKENLYLPLSVSANDILKKIKSDKIQGISNKIFTLPTDTLINKYIKEWILKAGINKTVSFHTSRHTFATLCLSLGVDLYTVSKLLGHKDTKNTQIYAKVIDESKIDAIDKLHVSSDAMHDDELNENNEQIGEDYIMSNDLQIFSDSNFGRVRIFKIDGKIMFVATDVAKALGYTKPNNAVNQHCRYTLKQCIGVKTAVRKDGSEAIQNIEMRIIPEGDVYRLIILSKLPSVEKFEKWVCDDILPTLRWASKSGIRKYN